MTDTEIRLLRLLTNLDIYGCAASLSEARPMIEGDTVLKEKYKSVLDYLSDD